MHDELLHTLQTRFEKNMGRHHDLKWEDIEAKLTTNQSKLDSLSQL